MDYSDYVKNELEIRFSIKIAATKNIANYGRA